MKNIPIRLTPPPIVAIEENRALPYFELTWGSKRLGKYRYRVGSYNEILIKDLFTWLMKNNQPARITADGFLYMETMRKMAPDGTTALKPLYLRSL